MALSWHDAVQDELSTTTPPLAGRRDFQGPSGAQTAATPSAIRKDADALRPASGVSGRVTDRSRSSRPPLEPPAILWFAVGLMLGVGIALLAAAPA